MTTDFVFDTDVDFQEFAAKGFRFESRTDDPATPADNRAWVRTDLDPVELRIRIDGVTETVLPASGVTLPLQLEAATTGDDAILWEYKVAGDDYPRTVFVLEGVSSQQPTLRVLRGDGTLAPVAGDSDFRIEGGNYPRAERFLVDYGGAISGGLYHDELRLGGLFGDDLEDTQIHRSSEGYLELRTTNDVISFFLADCFTSWDHNSETDPGIQIATGGDSQARFQVLAGGEAQFGPGGTDAPDTLLRRNAEGLLEMGAIDGAPAVSPLATQAYVATQIPTTEVTQDLVGAMLSGNTETGITVDYQDSDGTIDFAVTDSPLLGGQSSAYHLARANHTGTQPISTILAAATARFFGRKTAAGGAGEELTAADAKTILALAAADISDFDSQVASTAILKSIVDADSDLIVGTADNTVGRLAVAASRIIGRKATGSIGALTAAEIKTILAIVAADVSDFSTAADARISAVVTAAFINALSGVDADTLGGQSAAALQTAITAAIVDSAPGTLDTLNELAAALGDDPNFATTIATALGTKATLVSGLVGNGVDTVVDFAHGLGTYAIKYNVWDAAGARAERHPGAEKPDDDTLRLTFGTPPAANSILVVVDGL